MIIEVIEVMIDVVGTTSGRSGATMSIVVIGHSTATATATVENGGHHVQLEREGRCS